MIKRVSKECKILIRVREYENIEFRSSGEIDIEYHSEEDRITQEKKFWKEIVDDVKSAMMEWSGSIRHGGAEAAKKFAESSMGAVSAKSQQRES
jgi:hypothetical protein